MPRPTIRVATAHLSPLLLDPAGTTTKILRAISHAASQRATLISFPESFLPGFPIWSALLPPAHPATHAFFARFAAASVYADGPEVQRIREAARRHGVAVSVGISEKRRGRSGTLWNSHLLIDGRGEVRCHHRKLQPTFYERLSWGMGDGAGLRSVLLDAAAGGTGVTPATNAGGHGGDGGLKFKGKEAAAAPSLGGAEQGILNDAAGNEDESFRLGALICGENTNPLARYALMAQGEDIHVSTWPAVWPTHMPTDIDAEGPSSSSSANTKGSGSSNQNSKDYDNVLANRLRAGAHCFESKCFGVMSAAALSRANVETLTGVLREACTDERDREAMVRRFEIALERSSRAASMVLDPAGRVVKGWVVRVGDGGQAEAEAGKGGKWEIEEVEMLREEEGVLFADLDLELTVEGKQYHDLVGGYQRFDVFELSVDRTRREGVVFR